MLGSFIGKYKDCLTDERGAVVVSFTVEGSEPQGNARLRRRRRLQVAKNGSKSR